MVTPTRVACTIRMDRDQYDALQATYYATINEHRMSFNAWIVGVIAAGNAADCHPEGSPAALLAELTATIRHLGHLTAAGEDQTHAIRNAWMMRFLTRCEAALGLAPGGSTQ